MASAASEIPRALDPHVVLEESSSAGVSQEEAPSEAAVIETAAADGEAKEEEGECGFSLFMKGGRCKEAFVSWEDCVEAADKEGSGLVESCSQVNVNLKKCMDAHADYYYGPVLQDPHVVFEESPSVGGSREEAAPKAAAAEAVVETEAADGETKEEEGECGFCVFMKGGGCKEAFMLWEQCVQAAEKEGSDIVEHCSQANVNLKKCMDVHADYYAPVLQVKQAVSIQPKAAI